MVFNLYDELRALVDALNAAGLDYALCGGLALAVHAEPRATRDIDILISAEDLTPVKTLARGLGYNLEAGPMRFHSGLEVHRVSRVADGELFTLDLALVNAPLRAVWATREQVLWRDQPLWVVSRDGLVEMKRWAGRPQDLADIDKLTGGGERHD